MYILVNTRQPFHPGQLLHRAWHRDTSVSSILRCKGLAHTSCSIHSTDHTDTWNPHWVAEYWRHWKPGWYGKRNRIRPLIKNQNKSKSLIWVKRHSLSCCRLFGFHTKAWRSQTSPISTQESRKIVVWPKKAALLAIFLWTSKLQSYTIT